MTQEQIVQFQTAKNVKMFLLSQLGIKNGEIAKLLGTNAGHVYNALKEYKDKPDKAEKARQIAAGFPLNGKPMPHPETEDNQLI